MIVYQVYDANGRIKDQFRTLDTAKGWVSIFEGNLDYSSGWHQLGKYRCLEGRRGDEAVVTIVEVITKD